MTKWITIATLLLAFTGLQAQVEIAVSEDVGCAPHPIIISVTNPGPGTIASYFWEVTYPDNTVETSTSSQYIDILSMGGAYDVTLTINGTETVTVTGMVVVNAPPVAAFSVNDTIGCAPFCATFTDESVASGGDIVEWTWDLGSGNISTVQNPTACYDNPGVFTPVFSIEDENGCFSSISVPQMITVVDDYPVASFEPSSLSDCNLPSTIDFANNSSGDDLISSWDFDDGLTQTTTAPSDISHTFNALGDYNVCLSVEDAIGCVVDSCVTIAIVDAPEPSFNMSESVTCAGGTVIFEATSNPMPNAHSWDFNGDGTIDAIGDTVAFVYNDQGIFNPVLYADYSPTCSGESDGSMSIEVLAPLNIDFSTDVTVACSTPVDVNFGNLSTGQNILGYEWLIDGVSSGTDEDLSYTFGDYGVFDVGLVVNTSSCSDTLQLEDHIVIQSPTISFSGPDIICTGEDVVLSNIEVDSVEEIANLLWDFDGDGITDITGDNPIFQYGDPGIYNVEVFIETTGGCTSNIISDQSIEVQPDVVSAFEAAATEVCASEPVEFCAEDLVESTTYGWNFGDGSGWVTTSFPNDCITHDYQDTGYFDVTLSVYNAACSSILELEDYIYVPPPIAQLDFEQDCANLGTVQFFEECIEADSLVWDFGDGSPLVIDVPDPVHTYASPGTYTVTLVAFNFESGCEDDVTQLVVTEPEEVAINASSATGCAPITPFFSSPDQNQYVLWEVDFGNGYTLTSEQIGNTWWLEVYNGPLLVNSQTFGLGANWWPTYIPYTEGGIYDISFTVTDSNGCSYAGVEEEAVEVFNDLSFAEIQPTILEGCDSVLIQFETDNPFITSYSWTFSDGETSVEAAPVHEFEMPWDTTFAATLQANDQFGCFSTDTVVVDLVPPPIPAFSIEVSPTCIGDQVQVANNSTGDVVNYTWDFGAPGSPGNVQNGEAPTFTYEENGEYDICLSAENSGGCVQTFCIENAIEILSPVASFDFNSQMNNCLFGVQFENTTDGNVLCSQWSFGDGQFGGGMTPFHTYPIGVYDVELVVCNEFGCYDTTSTNDIFNFANVIGPYTTFLDDTLCAPFQVEFEAYNTADQSFSYFWEFDDGFGDPNNNTVTNHTYNEPGTYCPSLILEDANGCPFLIECEEPIVVEEFIFDISAVDPICFGDSTTVTFNGAETYTFSNPENFQLVEETTYDIWSDQSVQLQVTGTFGDCVSEQFVDLTVNPLPDVTLELPEALCTDAGVVELNTGLPSGPSGVYSINDVPATSFDPETEPGNYTIIYDYTDDNGCLNSDTSIVTINALPVVTFVAPDPLCEADQALLLNSGLPAGGTYEWDGSLITAFDPQTSGFGSFDVTYSFTDQNNCTNTAVAPLTVNAQPEALFEAPDLCDEDELPLQSDAVIAEGSIVNTEWTLDNATLLQDGTSGAFSAEAPVTVSATLTVTSDAGCISENTQTFEVFAAPVAAFSTEDVCANTNIPLTDESTSEGAPLSFWAWSVNGAPSATGQNPGGYSPPLWGDYEIELITATSDGCTDTATTVVTVHPLPETDVDLSSVCADSPFNATNNSGIPQGNIISYQWFDSFGNASETQNFDATYPNPGGYELNLVMTSDFGCVTDTGFSFEVFPLPAPGFDASETAFCQFGSIDLNDNSFISSGEIIAWDWFVNGELFSSGEQTAYAADEAGIYDISLTVTSDEGCTATASVEGLLEIWPSPFADFVFQPDDPTTIAPFTFVDDRSVGADQWEYFVSDGAFYNTPDFEHSFPGEGVYEIQQFVTNAFGCTDSLTLEIEVAPDLVVYVPNAFTPDQDGTNEVFRPVISGDLISEYTFRIFNRWGEMIFESTDPGEGWAGNARGGDHFVPDGMYIWQLEVATEEYASRRILNGSVTILR